MSPAGGWVGAWSTAQYGPYPAGPLGGIAPPPFDAITTPTAFPDNQALDQTFRMVVRPSLGGDKVRVRLSNVMGAAEVVISEVRLALRLADAAIIASTDTPVAFGGSSELRIPAGAEVVSDPVEFSFTPADDVAVSVYIQDASGPMTWHAVSFATQHVTAQNAGNATRDATGERFTETTLGWFYLSGLDVLREDALGSIVAIGDSITDGAYIVPDSNTRWPDLLAQRLQAANIPMGVLNQGINSNLVTDAAADVNRGPAAVLRFDRDVLERPGVRSVVIFEGTNDLGQGVPVDEIIAGLDELVRRAQAADLCVVLGTITPRADAVLGYDRASREPGRQQINAWIREQAETGRVDGLAGFDVVMGSAADPTYPDPALYAPDLLHPNSAGFAVMADAVPIEALAPPPAGHCQK